MALTAAVCFENWLRKVCFFTAIRHSYKTQVSKKATVLMAVKYRENLPNRLVNILEKKSTALNAARCCEYKLR